MKETNIKKPDIIYHYTDAKGLIGIFESSDLWLTNSMYLNDLSEFKYACDLIIDTINRYIKSVNIPRYQEELESCLNIFSDFKERYSCYLFCFCQEGNLLSQWRGYGAGGGGYSIGFDFNSINNIKPFSLNRVIYSEKKQIQIVNSILNGGLIKTKQLMGAKDDSLSLIIVGLVVDCFLSFKHPCFSEENEWRLVLQGDPEDYAKELGNDIYPIHFRESNNHIVPYVKLKQFQQDLPRLPIKEVFIGPTANSELSSKSILMLLGKCGYSGVKVNVSGIPLR